MGTILIYMRQNLWDSEENNTKRVAPRQGYELIKHNAYAAVVTHLNPIIKNGFKMQELVTVLCKNKIF